MRRIHILLTAVLLLCGYSLMAQGPVNRTSKTIIADVLAQMPATDQKKYNDLMENLSSTGEEGVLILTNMINTSDEGAIASIEYALSGLTYYVMRNGVENTRLMISNAYLRSLKTIDGRGSKAFIIRQLQILGKDECVDQLCSYLNDEVLSAPAASALASIRSRKSVDALLDALGNHSNSIKVQRNILQAISDTGVNRAESVLINLLNASDSDLQREILYALSRVGTYRSLDILANATEKAGYTMDKKGASEAYMALIKRVAVQGDLKKALDAAIELQEGATKVGEMHTREAAFQLLLSIKQAMGDAGKADIIDMLKASMKDTSRDYRNAALNYASGFAEPDLYIELLKIMMKANSVVKVDILNWIGREAESSSKHDIIQNLKINYHLSITQILSKQLGKDDFDVKEAAAWVMVKLGHKSYALALATLLKSKDKKTILLGRNTLSCFLGDINASVAKIIPECADNGKIAALELLSLRKAKSCIDIVLEETKSKAPEVKEAAYVTLKNVVEERDFAKMCNMLETADMRVAPFIQNAVISAISSLSTTEQLNAIMYRMSQAGIDKKHLYYFVLSSIKDLKALDMIVEEFHLTTGFQRDAAFKALLNWKGMEVSDELYSICKENIYPQYFDQALNAYMKLISNSTLTGENRLIKLREVMEIAKTDLQKVAILKQIGKTGTFLGLLYAGTFLDQIAVQQAAAEAVMDIALGNKEYMGSNTRALLKKVMQVLNNKDAYYQKEAIKKYLAEMPEREGFVSLFNGKDLTGWKGLVRDPIARAKMNQDQLDKEQIKADEIMHQGWTVKDGILIFTGKGNNLCTEKKYGDFEMYVDWKLDPAGPEPDAGIYLRGTPQVQIWDTSRVNVGAQVGSGGLYNNQVNLSKPLRVADNKLGEWNSFYIKMIGDRVTVFLNGEKVVDNVILENFWDRKQPIFPIEQIELQAHGSKVYYRDIYIKELSHVEPFKLSPKEEKDGFKVLFDGTNMDKWTGNTTDYTSEDGCISVHPTESFGGNLYTKDEYANFIFRFDFQLTPAANNGVGIRTPMEGDAAYVGMEVQILDCEHPVYKDITPLQHHGSVYGIIPAKADHYKAFKPVGEWNSEEIVANGDNICVKVNGIVILEGNIREAVKNGTPDHKSHPGLFNKKGHIAFLGHGSSVKFRNIRIKELK